MMPLAALLLHLVAATTSAGDTCGSLPRTVGARTIDLAPPAGWVEICDRDAALCKRLTANYPPSVTTLGYFVPSDEWAAHERAPTAPFARYLIAQVVPGKTAAQLPEVKSFIRSQAQDPTPLDRLAERLRGDGQAQLGIFEDAPDAIAFGVRQQLDSDSDTGIYQSASVVNSGSICGGCAGVARSMPNSPSPIPGAAVCKAATR